MSRDADIVLVSDYLKGCITADTMAAVLHAAAPRGIAVLVDPKIPHLDLYRGVTLVTPNQVEAETATHARIRTDDEARGAARRLRERLALRVGGHHARGARHVGARWEHHAGDGSQLRRHCAGGL